MQLYIGPKGPQVPAIPHARNRRHANVEILVEIRHHFHHLLQTRYLLTGTRRSVTFFTKRLPWRSGSARISSDRLFLIARLNGKYWLSTEGAPSTTPYLLRMRLTAVDTIIITINTLINTYNRGTTRPRDANNGASSRRCSNGQGYKSISSF